MRVAYQSKIGQRIITTSLNEHLHPNFRESGLHPHIYIKLNIIFGPGKYIIYYKSYRRVHIFKQNLDTLRLLQGSGKKKIAHILIKS